MWLPRRRFWPPNPNHSRSAHFGNRLSNIGMFSSIYAENCVINLQLKCLQYIIMTLESQATPTIPHPASFTFPGPGKHIVPWQQ